MTQGFSPYSGDSFDAPSGGFPGQGASGPGYPGGPGGFGPGPQGPGGPVAPLAGSTGTGMTRTSAPVKYLLPSFAAGLIALVLNAVATFGDFEATDTSFAILSGIAWALAGLVGITALGGYFAKDNKHRGSGFYTEIGWKKTLYWVTVVMLVVAIIWSAVDIAQWVGKW